MDKKILVLIFILLLASIFRLSYLNWGLPNYNHPYSYHPDEAKQLDSIANMHPEKLDFNPDEFIYPSLQYYVNAFALGTASLLGYVQLVPDISFYIKHPLELGKLFLVGRFVTFLFSIATVIFVYLVGRRMQCEKTGLLAAFILAIFPLHIIESHYMAVDVPLTFWITLTLFFSTYILKEDKWWPYVLAGLSAGLATATKYPGVFAWLLILEAHIIRTRALLIERLDEKTDTIRFGTRIRFIIGELWNKKLIISGLFLILGFFITSPYVFIDYQHSIPAILGQWNLGHTTQFDNLGGNGIQYHQFTYLLLAAFPLALGLPLFLLLLYCIFWPANKQLTWLMLAFMIPFFLLFATSKFIMIRYLVPFLPFISLIVASEFIMRKKAILSVLMGAALFYTMFLSITHTNAFAVDTRDQALDWIRDNVKDNSTLLVTSWSPLRYTPLRDPLAVGGREVNDAEILRFRSQLRTEDVGHLKVMTMFDDFSKAPPLSPDYIVVTSLDWSQYYRNQSKDANMQTGLGFYKNLRETSQLLYCAPCRYELVATFDRPYFTRNLYVILDPRFESGYASPKIEVYKHTLNN